MSDGEPLTRQRKLLESLARMLEKEGNSIQVFETHISWVLVAGNFAYKFKKALRFDFVDYSTLERRHFYCKEELRLNRRLAPDIYLSVASITGSRESPAIDGNGPAIEYAVKMRAFEQQALWTRRLEHRLVSPEEIDALATIIARFHQTAVVAPKDSAWCTPDALQALAHANLTEIAALVDKDDERQWVDELRKWDCAQRRKLSNAFVKRKEMGFIRECHGDLHGGNILTIDGQVEVFDCIEFNDSLRWIDVMNDIAFTCMDLAFRQRPGYAARFLNRYLAATGDYEGLAVLRYYEICRALVRCKVALLRARQLRDARQEESGHEQPGENHLAFAMHGITPTPSAVLITRGFSGSGKTTFSSALVELTGAIQLRSDVERKRMHGLSATDRAAAAPGMNLYDAATTRSTYEHLRTLARCVVESGRPVIVDAAFLGAEHRALFSSLASELRVPFLIFDIQASEATMRARIISRESVGHDASDAGLEVLMHQLVNHDPLSIDEARNAITVDMNSGIDPDRLRKACEPVLNILQGRHHASGLKPRAPETNPRPG
jgi:aminoglycoside phosphotransferase family enzyme/predicted kinase